MAAPAVAPAAIVSMENDAFGHGVGDPLRANVHVVTEQVVAVVVVEVTHVEPRADMVAPGARTGGVGVAEGAGRVRKVDPALPSFRVDSARRRRPARSRSSALLSTSAQLRQPSELECCVLFRGRRGTTF